MHALHGHRALLSADPPQQVQPASLQQSCPYAHQLLMQQAAALLSYPVAQSRTAALGCSARLSGRLPCRCDCLITHPLTNSALSDWKALYKRLDSSETTAAGSRTRKIHLSASQEIFRANPPQRLSRSLSLSANKTYSVAIASIKLCKLQSFFLFAKSRLASKRAKF